MSTVQFSSLTPDEQKYYLMVQEIMGRVGVDDCQRLRLARVLLSKDQEIESLKQSEYQMQLARLMVNNHELKQQIASLKDSVRMKDEALENAKNRLNEVRRSFGADVDLTVGRIDKALNAGKEGGK